MDRSPKSKSPGSLPSRSSPAAAVLRRQIAALLPELRAFARFLVRDKTEADDLTQESLVRALGALDRFEDGTRLKAWLFTILRNTFYEQARRRRTETAALMLVYSSVEISGAHQDGEAELGDLQRTLWTLPPLLREALILVGAQGLSQEEAAAICNVPVGTIKARVSRARTQIAKSMSPLANGSGPHIERRAAVGTSGK